MFDDEKIEELFYLLENLEILHNNLYKTIESIYLNAKDEFEFMKMNTMKFNDITYEINILYKDILNLCLDLYWCNEK